MSSQVAPEFGAQIAERMTAEHQSLAARWLERLNALLPVEPNEVFPTDHLLDHIPSLIVEIADHLRAPQGTELAANTLMVAKARELGELRYKQRASVHQLLREYRILGGILSTFVQEETSQLHRSVDSTEAIALIAALSHAVSVLEQATVETFVRKYTATIDRQTARLENFNRMVSHELRQPIGALQFALKLCDTAATLDDRARYRAVADRNIARLNQLIDRLAVISRLTTPDSAQMQQLELGLVVREAVRQLRDMADSRGVEMRIADKFPCATSDVAALELVLINLLSNAIKYSNPAAESRFVEVSAESEGTNCTLIVRDNGIGIAKDQLEHIFDRAYRAHVERDDELGTDGYGLGLTIVRDCVSDQQWDLSVESEVNVGTTFRLTIPISPEPRSF